jgi:dienelactone hydrolase
MRPAILAVFVCIASSAEATAKKARPPLDLWTSDVMARIRDRTTLNVELIPRDGYYEVFYDSEIGTANWADSAEPFALHRGDTIRIHGYLASPGIGGPYPGIVVGHGHHGRGSPDIAKALAVFGYVGLSIDGPEAGQSTGGPEDTEQAWISVEPSANFGFLYHYAYAGMRGLTLLELLSGLRKPSPNFFRIDRNNLGVMGASMGGQFTYYINGVDRRVKAAVALAVAGDWRHQIFYPGAWLYHGLYYYTRDGLASGTDHPNAISDVCRDPTLDTFLRYFDPISYAPTQNAPLLTIVGTHDQYFALPSINTTFDRVAPASPRQPRFRKNILLVPNGKHGILRGEDDLETILTLLFDAHAWLQYAFHGASRPPGTPAVAMDVDESSSAMVFRVAAASGTQPIASVDLSYATQIDTLPARPNDFQAIPLPRRGKFYEGRVPIGNGVTPSNVLYFATVRDWGGFAVSSRMYYRRRVLAFCDDFLPTIEHPPTDDFPVPPAPSPNCGCER